MPAKANAAVNCHSRMELRPPTARKSHPNFFAYWKRSTKMKKYKKTIIPNAQITMRTSRDFKWSMKVGPSRGRAK